ncbi:MAG TPA: adenylosuccinate lyase [Steroidobacteraceae bacterium]|jgi:adenylosuccinate lyase
MSSTGSSISTADTAALTALSPLDGRYRRATEPLRELLSESGLIRERIRIEAHWLLHLAQAAPMLAGANLTAGVRVAAQGLAEHPPQDAAGIVKRIEARTNHDVKAVEYYVREVLQTAGATGANLELVHFGCTSEDLNNLSYAKLLSAARLIMLGAADELIRTLTGLAQRYAALPMLARTHGQPASPTTLGKEFANVVARLRRAHHRLVSVEILGKWNGAVGNFNAHVAALPELPWPQIAQRFVESLGLVNNPLTTQIEPHDWIGEYCDALAAINVITIDLCRDIWGYISLGYLRQQPVAGEVGSSTMPHKINPIDFENAEGNLGLANALLRHFAEKLPMSRWQRDLTDSTVLRNIGVALGHTLVAWRSTLRGLAKIDVDPVRIGSDINTAWEVLGEAVQTVLRARGVPAGYELLKDFTRGQAIDGTSLAAFIETLPITAAEKVRLQNLKPQDYVGLAAELARKVP